MIRKTKRRKHPLRATHWQTIALLILLAGSLTFNTLMIQKILFPPTTIIYGEDDYTDRDDYICTMIGNKLMNTTAQICCEKYPIFTTIDHSINLTFDTTQCLKISNIHYK